MARYLCTGAVILAGSLAGPVLAQEKDRSARILSAAGNDQILWIVTGEWEGERFLNYFAWVERASLQIRQVPWLLPQEGEVQRSAVVGETLHVFYRSGVHYSYSSSESRRGLRLPDNVVPAAIAGGPGEPRPVLWAVVPAETARKVANEWAEIQRADETQPAESLPDLTEVPSMSTRPAGQGFELVRYNGLHWQPAFPAPDALTSGERVWLAVGGERQLIFWKRAPGAQRLRFARRVQDEWVEGPTIEPGGPIEAAFAGVLNKRVVFAALVSRPGESRPSCKGWVLVPDEDRWLPLGTPVVQVDQERQPLVLPEGSVLAGFVDKVAVLRMGDAGPQLGFWSPGDPLVDFRPVEIRRTPVGSPGSAHARELAATAVVTVVLLLVFWLRHDSISSPASLPPGLAVADIGRRGAAAFVDMLPSALIVGLIWHAPLAAYIEEFRRGSETGERAPWPDQLTWAWLAFIGLYTAWCLGFELYLTTTPGKRLLRCAVTAEGAEPATRPQIVLRNVLRLLELEPHLHIWPFVLVVFLTRNRQRIGDLLARTLVVERRPILQGSEDEDGTTLGSHGSRRREE